MPTPEEIANNQVAFDKACANFDKAIELAKSWRQNFPGSVYSTRLSHACAFLEASLAFARQAIAEDNAFSKLLLKK